MVTLMPYLNFRGQARDALTFYQSVLGGELQLMPFSEMPDAFGVTGDQSDWLMHGQLSMPDGFAIAAADMPDGFGEYAAPSAGVTLTYTGGPEDHERLAGFFAALSEGGSTVMPLELAPWGDHYGAFTDRFGVSWSFDIGQ